MADAERITENTKKPIEFWLERKLGELAGKSGLPEKNDPAQQDLRLWYTVARTRAICNWPLGQQVTEGEFDEGLQAAKNHDPHKHALSLCKKEG